VAAQRSAQNWSDWLIVAVINKCIHIDRRLFFCTQRRIVYDNSLALNVYIRKSKFSCDEYGGRQTMVRVVLTEA
jgi:hypothetical protein